MLAGLFRVKDNTGFMSHAQVLEGGITLWFTNPCKDTSQKDSKPQMSFMHHHRILRIIKCTLALKCFSLKSPESLFVRKKAPSYFKSSSKSIYITNKPKCWEMIKLCEVDFKKFMENDIKRPTHFMQGICEAHAHFFHNMHFL